MVALKGACVVGQSGGPTAVINSSAAGVIFAAFENEKITRVLAMENGIVGLLNDRLFDLSFEERTELELLKFTPSSALGSCRYKLKDYEEDETDYIRILNIFKEYDIRYFFYIGGNDSMDTCNKISKYMLHVGYECRIIGIPKTIDNDLYGTDHSPGFGSAAKYISTITAEVSRDNQVYGTKSIVVIETMGRNAGWLAASAALASVIGEGPDKIYLPENIFSIDSFIMDIKLLSESKNSIIVIVSEGIRDDDGRFITEYTSSFAKSKDAFGHSQMGGLATSLAEYIKERTGLKTRGIELSLLQRCATHISSRVDVDEAYMVGVDALKYATTGASGMMVALERNNTEKYVCSTKLIPLFEVANKEQTIPNEWINKEKNYVTEGFIKYALPLIDGEVTLNNYYGLPRYSNLKRVFTK